VYAIVLHHIHDRYTPDWIWLTVVGGNLLILMALLALCLTSVLPLAAFFHGAGLNVAAGVPIIIWQLWQQGQRTGESRTGGDQRPPGGPPPHPGPPHQRGSGIVVYHYHVILSDDTERMAHGPID